MRGITTPVTKIRRQVFTEIARLAYEDGDYSRIEEIPYAIIPGESASYRDSVFKERAIVGERLRLAVGLPLRPVDQHAPVSQGINDSAIADMFYEPPLINVISFACNACEETSYTVTDLCRSCIAHPCTAVCPVKAVSIVNGRSFIDKSKCVKCGRCAQACPYTAIVKSERPCAAACGVNAIESDEYGRAKINYDKCVSCGQCLVSCPFSAIADKSQIFQLIQAMKKGDEVIVELAPAVIGQFGTDVRLWKIKAALKEIGFAEVYEVALGADIGAITEAKHYVHEVATGKLPFLLTSCCPAWSVLAKRTLPEEMVESVSSALTPMVATARSIKQKHPNSRVVFVGPCAAKKLEASRDSVRSDVDFVITFEELACIFEAKGIDMETYECEEPIHNATGAGRGYAVSGGVSKAIEDCINEYYPGTDVLIEHVEGLSECQKMLLLAKAGKKDGCLIEGMGCPGGCVAGAGTNIPVVKGAQAVRKFVKDSTKPLPPKEYSEIELP